MTKVKNKTDALFLKPESWSWGLSCSDNYCAFENLSQPLWDEVTLYSSRCVFSKDTCSFYHSAHFNIHKFGKRINCLNSTSVTVIDESSSDLMQQVRQTVNTSLTFDLFSIRAYVLFRMKLIVFAFPAGSFHQHSNKCKRILVSGIEP